MMNFGSKCLSPLFLWSGKPFLLYLGGRGMWWAHMCWVSGPAHISCDVCPVRELIMFYRMPPVRRLLNVQLWWASAFSDTGQQCPKPWVVAILPALPAIATIVHRISNGDSPWVPPKPFSSRVPAPPCSHQARPLTFSLSSFSFLAFTASHPW